MKVSVWGLLRGPPQLGMGLVPKTDPAAHRDEHLDAALAGAQLVHRGIVRQPVDAVWKACFASFGDDRGGERRSEVFIAVTVAELGT